MGNIVAYTPAPPERLSVQEHRELCVAAGHLGYLTYRNTSGLNNEGLGCLELIERLRPPLVDVEDLDTVEGSTALLDGLGVGVGPALAGLRDEDPEGFIAYAQLVASEHQGYYRVLK